MWVAEDRHLGAEHGAADCWVAADSGANVSFAVLTSWLTTGRWRMQRALVCSGRRQRKLQQLAVAAGRVRGHARAGMRWEETCGAWCGLAGWVSAAAWRAVARWSQGRVQALGVLQERLVVQRMHVCSG